MCGSSAGSGWRSAPMPGGPGSIRAVRSHSCGRSAAGSTARRPKDGRVPHPRRRVGPAIAAGDPFVRASAAVRWRPRDAARHGMGDAPGPDQPGRVLDAGAVLVAEHQYRDRHGAASAGATCARRPVATHQAPARIAVDPRSMRRRPVGGRLAAPDGPGRRPHRRSARPSSAWRPIRVRSTASSSGRSNSTSTVAAGRCGGAPAADGARSRRSPAPEPVLRPRPT